MIIHRSLRTARSLGIVVAVLLSTVFSWTSAWAETPRAKAEVLVDQGLELSKKNEKKNSEEEAAFYRQAVEIDPTYASAWFNLGYVYQVQGEPGKAAEAYRRCLENDPERSDALTNSVEIATILREKGRTQDLQGALSALYYVQEKGNPDNLVKDLPQTIKALEQQISDMMQADVRQAYTQEDIVAVLDRSFTRGESPYAGPRLPVRIQFTYNSAEILHESKPQLVELARALKSTRMKDVSILIEGHTCGMGTLEYNQTLSLQRAESIREFLRKEGVPEHRLRVEGKNQMAPIRPNDTEEHRSLNRRVEFVNWNRLQQMRELLQEVKRVDDTTPYDQFLR